MARTRPHRFTAGICLLALASAVAAQDLALASFDPLNSNRVPERCKTAYMTPIRGCRRSDFTTEASCSAECVAGVQAMQDNIQANCGGVLLPVDTLLAQALLGNLVKVLCPGAEQPPVEEIPEQTTTLVFPSTTEAPTTIAFTTTLRGETTSEAEPSTLVTTTSSAETLVLPTRTPSIPSPDVQSPTEENEGTAETATDEEEEDQSFQPGPGGNDILNPVSAAGSMLPRLDLVVLLAATTYLIW